MARTATGRVLTEVHRQQQLTLRAEVLRRVLAQWKSWDLRDEASYTALQGALAAITQAGAQRSATLAGSYYQLFRLAEQPRLATDVAAKIMLASPPTFAEVEAVVNATAKTGVYNAFRAGKSYDGAMANGLVKVSGAVGRLVLNAGRATIEQTVRADKKAAGWTRVTGDAPCAFCAMLAGRGPVYKDDTAEFDAHDHCSCGAEPYYDGADWPGRAQEFADLYRSEGGLNGMRQAMK